MRGDGHATRSPTSRHSKVARPCQVTLLSLTALRRRVRSEEQHARHRCGYRYPAEIISQAVWLYFRFSLSLRDVEELLAERGLTVTYESIRAWCAKFGPSYAEGLRRRRARPSDKWHLDEVQLKIKGKRHWLWRAVDSHGVVLDILIQQRRDRRAAETFLRRVLAAVGPSHGW